MLQLIGQDYSRVAGGYYEKKLIIIANLFIVNFLYR